MVDHGPSAIRIRFGLFEADLQSGELWKAGRKIRLQAQPFKVLSVLVQHPGEVITRDELQEKLWGKQAAGDFDQSIGTAINKVRDALGDSAENPRFVETLARRGYRFIAPVSVAHAGFPEEIPGQNADGPEPGPVVVVDTSAARVERVPATVQTGPHPVAGAQRLRRGYLWALAGLVGGLGLAAFGGYRLGVSHAPEMPRIERLTRSGRIAPGIQAFESFPASVTDGLRIFTSVISNGRTALAQIDVHTGEVRPVPIPSDISSPMLGDLSPDGASLLLRSHLSPESEQPLWVVPSSGGSAMRLSNIVAHDATWMPDAKGVLYAAGDQMTIFEPETGTSLPFATLPGRAYWLRWSPDGSLLRFTLLDPLDHTVSLWQVGRDGKGARPVLKGWTQPASECCGSWTGDGKYFVFQSNAGGTSDLWRLEGKSTAGPTRVTNGPLSFVAPMTSRTGHTIHFIGSQAQTTLLEFDPKRRSFVQAPEFLAEANRVEYSRDQQWVIWADQQSRLWRARADGSERLQLTPESLGVFSAHWSADGQAIAMMAREPGKAWQIYTVSPLGGTPQRLLPESRNQADPTWSPDGRVLAFGRVTDIMGKEDGPRAIELLELKTGKVTKLPDSDGLFSPRWSPDGRYIAAITLDERRLMIYDMEKKSWRTLADTSVGDPVWSQDSSAIYFYASQAEMEPIYRVSVNDGRLERIADLSNFDGGQTADFFFCGLTRAGNPLVRSRMGTGDVYALDLDALGGH